MRGVVAALAGVGCYPYIPGELEDYESVGGGGGTDSDSEGETGVQGDVRLAGALIEFDYLGDYWGTARPIRNLRWAWIGSAYPDSDPVELFYSGEGDGDCTEDSYDRDLIDYDWFTGRTVEPNGDTMSTVAGPDGTIELPYDENGYFFSEIYAIDVETGFGYDLEPIVHDDVEWSAVDFLAMPDEYTFTPDLDTSDAPYAGASDLRFEWDPGGGADFVVVRIAQDGDSGIVQSFACGAPEDAGAIEFDESLWDDPDGGSFWYVQFTALRIATTPVVGADGMVSRMLGARSRYGVLQNE